MTLRSALTTWPLETRKVTVDIPAPEDAPRALATFDDTIVQLTLNVSASSPAKGPLPVLVATMSPERLSPSLSLSEIVPIPAALVLNVALKTSAPSKSLVKAIAVPVEKAKLPLVVTVPAHADPPHVKSMVLALARGINTATASRQAIARPDLKMILTMVSSPRNPSGRAATEKNPSAWKSNRDAKSLVVAASGQLNVSTSRTVFQRFSARQG